LSIAAALAATCGTPAIERGRPTAGYYTKHAAHAWLDDVLAEARRGELPGMVRTGATFKDADAEYMRWLEHDRERKPSTLRGYHSILHAHLLPEFGNCWLEDITTDQVEAWSVRLAATGRVNNRTRLKILTVLHGRSLVGARPALAVPFVAEASRAALRWG
jgi:hypothetical protein